MKQRDDALFFVFSSVFFAPEVDGKEDEEERIIISLLLILKQILGKRQTRERNLSRDKPRSREEKHFPCSSFAAFAASARGRKREKRDFLWCRCSASLFFFFAIRAREDI